MSQRFQGWGKRSIRVGLGVLLALFAIRLALPYALKFYINTVLRDHVEGYSGSIADLDLSLYRGAYQMQRLVFSKVENRVPVPFLSSREIDFSIAWKPLLRGHVVGRVSLDGFRVNFVNGPTEAQTQSGTEGKGWQSAVDELFPLEIEELVLRRSELHFQDFSKHPEVDIFMRDVSGKATNLTNTEKSSSALASAFELDSTVQTKGHFRLNGTFSLLKEPPAFDIDLAATKIQLAEFSDFFKAYANFDVGQGDLNVYAEAASIDGKIKGYVKPPVTHLQVLAAKDLGDDSATGADLLASLANLLVRRYSSDQVAAKIPFEGPLLQPKVDIWNSIKSVFGNVFRDELKKGSDDEIEIADAQRAEAKRSKSSSGAAGSPRLDSESALHPLSR